MSPSEVKTAAARYLLFGEGWDELVTWVDQQINAVERQAPPLVRGWRRVLSDMYVLENVSNVALAAVAVDLADALTVSE